MRKYAANAVTIAFLLLALAVAAWAAFQYNHLKRDVAAQQARLPELQSANAAQQARLAELQSANLHAEGGGYGIVDLANRLETLCRARPQSEQVRTFCSTQLPSLQALQLLALARQARIAAVQTGDHGSTRRAYGRLIDFLNGRPDDPWRREWLSLANEGVAYADMKLGRMGEARSVIGEADRLKPNDASIGATALKIQCLQRTPAGQVAAAFATLKRRLDERVASTDRAREEGRNARLERDFFARDAELYHLCAYAGVAAD